METNISNGSYTSFKPTVWAKEEIFGTQFEQQQKTINDYYKIAQEISQKEKDLTRVTDPKQYNKQSEELNKLREKLNGMASDVNEISSNWNIWYNEIDKSDPALIEYADKLKSGLDKIINANGDNPIYENLYDLFNAEEYKNVINDLQTQAKNGELSINSFTNTDSTNNFKEAFEEMGYSAQEVIDSINGSIESAEINDSITSTTELVIGLKGNLISLKETLDDTFINNDKFNTAVTNVK